MPKILDNIELSLGEDLRATLESSYRLDASIGYFNLRGWRLLADAVDALPRPTEGPKARILIGLTDSPTDEIRRSLSRLEAKPVDNQTANERWNDALDDLRAQLQVGRPTPEDEAALRTLKHQIEAGHVEVKFHAGHRLHAKLYLCHRADTAAPRIGYVGSSNLTQSGLHKQGELNTNVVDGDATAKLADWFEKRWNDRLSIPVDPELAKLIEESWAGEQPLDPYLVYLKMAYHLSKEARDGLVQFGLPASMERELLEFQTAAVQIAARIVMHKGGAMVGDVVGLGKTLVATAVARLLSEEHSFETLVICPKNLVNMWDRYLHRYEVRGRTMSLSMVHKELPEARRHRLVVIDESHNLRNERRRDYQAIKSYIADNESKVLLLSATPYNKHLKDIAAQLGLFINPEDDLGVRPEEAIAQHPKGAAGLEYDLKGNNLSSLEAFRRSEYLEDWQSLLSQYLVRRTRAFVEENYANTDDDGRIFLEFGSGEPFYFPKRVPKPVAPRLAPDDPATQMASDETLDVINDLRLPRYCLGDYLADPYQAVDADEQKLLDDLTTADRGNLSGLTRVMMFKRLSSSGPAFVATLQRHLLRNLVVLHALDERLPVPVGPVGNSFWDDDVEQLADGLDTDGGFYEATDADRATGYPLPLIELDMSAPASAYAKLTPAAPGRVRWVQPQAFLGRLREDLRADADAIAGLLSSFGPWQADQDGKLAELERIITDEHPNEKVLVFTEAADTAQYLAEELQQRGIEAVEAVTGSSEDPSSLARRFSPRSSGTDTPTERQLRVLISTDVLSEGQNLQDARIVVNYDLPWAIVQLVQRAGRVDRIGQEAPEVLVYSLLVADSIDAEIRLRERIRHRLAEQAALLGSDESFFGDPSERSRLRSLYDEHSDQRLDDGPVDDVDPVSMAYEVWRKAQQDHPELAKQVESLPDVVYATKGIEHSADPSSTKRDTPEGVVVHSRTVTGSDTFAFAPADGQASMCITAQEALRRAKCDPETPFVPRLDNHHALVESALDGPLGTSPRRLSSALYGVRKKVWESLNQHLDSFHDTLWFSRDDLAKALDAIIEYPLLGSATQQIANALKDRSLENLAESVIQLWRNDQLSRHPKGGDTNDHEPRIICSMALRTTGKPA